MPRTDETMEFDGLTFVRWVDAGRPDAECWYLVQNPTTPALHIWVKNYGERHTGQHFSSPFWGWRVGAGGSPRGPVATDRDEAMGRVRGLAITAAQQKVDEAWEQHRTAVALRDSFVREAPDGTDV